MGTREMAFIEAKDIFFSYKSRIGKIKALSSFSLSIEQGSFNAVIGSNGSGKSTFARILNGLLVPESGSLFIDGLDAFDKANTEAIRKTVGLVFQNPDNQIVGDTVEDDVAFGPENLGLKSSEIEKRVTEALKCTALTDLRFCNLNKLSGGQKQLVAIAGVLAMDCKCIVLDEATSMLDPSSAKLVLDTLHTLNREKGTTVILITHRLEECLDCDNIFVLDRGTVVLKRPALKKPGAKEGLC